jgi:alpha-D-xyloside xylohydrolase
MGISAIKTDFGESAPCKAHYQHIDGADMHNLYPRLYNEAVWEVFQEGYAQQPITWARSATVGCQTMPVHWGGDPSALWPHLAGSLWGALSFGLSGGLFWSCDIGGFGGARQPDEELYTRWLQFGAFNSHMRVHGNMEREPWKFGETALAVFRKFTKLRYRLLPYLLSEAQYAVETMRPMMCAMPLAFPDDPICEGIGDQYMFGRALLIAPLLTAGGTRRVYLPAGTWFDFWSKEKISGGRYINVTCPLDSYPVFVRDGALLPLALESNRLQEGSFTELTVEVYHATVDPAPYLIADHVPFTLRFANGQLEAIDAPTALRLTTALFG